MRGVPIEAHDTLAEIDVLAPHKFLDAFLELPGAHFPLGAQHDAAEALEVVFDHSGALSALFHHGSAAAARSDVVVPYLSEDFRIQPFAVRTLENDDAVDMNAFLQSCINNRAGKLTMVPEILAVRLPPLVKESDDNRFWLAIVYDAV